MCRVALRVIRPRGARVSVIVCVIRWANDGDTCVARTRFSHQLVVGSVYITVHVRPSRLTAPQRPTGNARRCPRTLRATSRLRDANRGSVVLRSVTNPGPAAGATASGGSAAPLVSRVYARTKLSNVRDRSTRTKFLEQLSIRVDPPADLTSRFPGRLVIGVRIR